MKKNPDTTPEEENMTKKAGCEIKCQLTLMGRAGGQKAQGKLYDYFSATECQINFKPSCIFKFVSCFEVYKKRLIILDFGGTLESL